MNEERADLLSRMRVASPCPASWEAMAGDERVRFCRLCDLHVYDFSELTRAEAESLVARTEGRLCARLYRRADGTVLTKDCPTGLRAARRRAGRAAGAVFAAVLSLCGVAFGQGKSKRADACESGSAKVSRTAKPGKGSALKGVVFDPNGAVIPGASVLLTENKTKKKFAAHTSDEGAFEFAALPHGVYQVEAVSPGFKKLRMTYLAVGAEEAVGLDLTLHVEAEVMIGVVAVDDMRPAFSRDGNGVTTFNEKQVTKLPIP
ncbi:MAG: carboxypeptidase-like regulatory domain-containing protein [Pyrinomonadaceae bacterium]